MDVTVSNCKCKRSTTNKTRWIDAYRGRRRFRQTAYGWMWRAYEIGNAGPSSWESRRRHTTVKFYSVKFRYYYYYFQGENVIIINSRYNKRFFFFIRSDKCYGTWSVYRSVRIAITRRLVTFFFLLYRLKKRQQCYRFLFEESITILLR